MNSNEIITAKGISKSFISVQALKNIDITIERQSVLCFAGENGCGKSTLVKTLSGIHKPDEGEIIINGKSYSSLSSRTAINEGIQVIYQDLSLFKHMNVAENIAINKLIKSNRKYVSKKEMYEIAKEQLTHIGVSLNLDTAVEGLSVANRQIIAICRSLALDAKVLFMDEPTTALTKQEVDRLLSIVMELKKKGMAIVFISHKLDEVFKIADRIAVFRDGEKVGEFKGGELDEKKLGYYMTGREVSYQKYERQTKDESKILEVKNLSKKGQYENISFSCRKGDIIGLIGLLGSGRTEIALSLFGLNKPTNGEILFEGKPVNINSPVDAKNAGIVLLSEDRTTQGLFIGKNVKENMSSAVLKMFAGILGILNFRKEDDFAKENVKSFKVKTPSVQTIIKTLSGGNQQKAIISKWVSSNPKVFIMDSPTVGIDIGSKSDIYKQIQELAKEGMCIIFISDEIEEIIYNCNKIIVMSNGKIVSVENNNGPSEKGKGRKIMDLISA